MITHHAPIAKPALVIRSWKHKQSEDQIVVNKATENKDKFKETFHWDTLSQL